MVSCKYFQGKEPSEFQTYGCYCGSSPSIKKHNADAVDALDRLVIFTVVIYLVYIFWRARHEHENGASARSVYFDDDTKIWRFLPQLKRL